MDEQVKVRGYRVELGEIEATLRQHPTVREAVVVVQAEGGQPRLIGYVVPQAGGECRVEELLAFLKRSLPEYMVPAVLVPLKVLPLTPNGKLDRRALPNSDALRPEMAAVYIAPRTVTETTLAQIWQQVLRLKQVSIHDNFFELGGDSILSIQVVARAKQAGLQLTPKQLFDCPTIAELATVAETAPIIQAEQGIVTGEVAITPIQHWFFQQPLQDPHYWNQALLFEARQPLDADCLSQAVQHWLERHDALRIRFTLTESGWQQVNSGFDPAAAVPVSYYDWSGRTIADPQQAMDTVIVELEASLNLAEGPLLRVALFNFGADQPQRLLIIIHHLVVDGISWRILLEDLQRAYQQLSQGQPVQLPPKTTSFKQWSQFLQDYARSTALQQERLYWLDLARHSIPALPIDFANGDNTVASAQTVSSVLGADDTQALLQQVPAVYRTQINDVLLTALAQSFGQWTGEPALFLDLEGHGREAIAEHLDVSETVGWFTTLFPVRLSLESMTEPGDALKLIKEQLRQIPNRGIGYGILRYLSDDAALVSALSKLPPAAVRFNYLGQFDQILPADSWFDLVLQTIGPNRSPRDRRCYLIDINGYVVEGQLRLEWMYSEQVHHRATVQRLADGFIQALQLLIHHCQSVEAVGYTPSDFPEANLTQAELDRFIAKVSQLNGGTTR
jgi:non-ribosomal peptide synthase protein (TIGR01720 family)